MRPFRYDLNQIPHDCTVEVRNRFKGLDLIDRVPEELCMEVLFLQRGVLASGSFQEWTVKLGSFGMWHHPRGYVSNFLMRPASS